MIIEAGFVDDSGPIDNDGMTERLLFDASDGWSNSSGTTLLNDEVTAGDPQTCGFLLNEGYEAGGDAIAFDGVSFTEQDRIFIRGTNGLSGPLVETTAHNVEIRFIKEAYEVTDDLPALLLLDHTISSTEIVVDVLDHNAGGRGFTTKVYTRGTPGFSNVSRGTPGFSNVYGILIRYYDIQHDQEEFDIQVIFSNSNGSPRRYTD